MMGQAFRYSHLLRPTTSAGTASWYLVNRLHKPFGQPTAARCFSASLVTPKQFTPSPEQKQIVELCRTQNVVVSARPGSGKTATARCIVEAMPESPIFIITYSKALQLETKQRLQDHRQHCDIATFHSMAGKLFGDVVFTDQSLRAWKKKGIKPSWNGPLYDVVVLDELQDSTYDLYWLTCAFLEALTRARGGSHPRLVVLGDERQCIYQFKDADARHLSLAPSTLGSLSPYPWAHVSLPQSFRLSQENTNFLNRGFLGGDEYVQGSHSGPKPLYVYCNHDTLNGSLWFEKELVPMIKEYGPGNTAIIAPSIRKNKYLARLTNKLTVGFQLPVAVSVSDEVTLDNDVLHGKISVSTIHQFKGKERDLVIAYSLLSSRGEDSNSNICPNQYFVALTRAKKQLIVTHDQADNLKPFMSIRDIEATAECIDLSFPKTKMKPAVQFEPHAAELLPLPGEMYVTDMPRYLDSDALEAIIEKHLVIETVSPPLPQSLQIHAPDKVKTDEKKGHYEVVSDINGMVVVSMYELALMGTLKTLGFQSKTTGIPSEDQPGARTRWLCRRACKHEGESSRYKSRWYQMRDSRFDWLVKHAEVAKDRLARRFLGMDDEASNNLQFEVSLGGPNHILIMGNNQDTKVPAEIGATDFKDTKAWSGFKRTRIKGRADIIQQTPPSLTSNSPFPNTTIWEIKLSAHLSLEHIIQLAAYGYLWCYEHGVYDSASSKAPIQPPVPEMRLFNVRDSEERIIRPRNGAQSLQELVQDIIRLKYSAISEVSTDEFLRSCDRMRAMAVNAKSGGNRQSKL